MRSQGIDLAPFFEAGSVALLGASDREGSLGSVVLKNMIEAGFEGPIYPVNPKYEEIQGRRCYPSVSAIGETVDLAVVVTPAKAVPGLLEDCGKSGVSAAVVLSAGFREAGEDGRQLEKSAIRIARQYGIRFIGPNCLGVQRSDIKLNATFSQAMAKPGRIALVSQSGAIITAMLDWAEPRHVGFSTVISSGIAADVDFGEILDYLVFDPATRAIMLYIEGIHDSRKFMSAVRAASRVKPVIVMKGGRYSAGGQAAVSHTGALVGSDDVFDAALMRAGAVRVKNYAHFFGVAETLHSGLQTKGSNLAIVTNGGGPGVIAADFLADKGLPLATLSEETMAKLNEKLPQAWSGGNPVDVLGDAPADLYAAAVEACLADPNVHTVLAILIPQAMTEPLSVAKEVEKIAKNSRKPVLTCWMGESSMRSSWEHFREAGVPTYATPESAIQAFAASADHHANQRLLLQVPEPAPLDVKFDRTGVRLMIENALAEGRKILNIVESKALLSAYGLPVVPSLPAHDAAEALAIAEELGFPVAMKIHSSDITHKSDVGGVRLGISNGRDVQATFKELVESAERARPDAKITGVVVEKIWSPATSRKLMLGVINDAAFGPALTVGLGGTLVELIRDRAIGLPPLNRFLARKMIEGTRAARYLKEFRGLPAANQRAVEDVLLSLSAMICELPWIEELDINPLIVDENEARAVDARVVLRRVSPAARRYSHMAIHPYPIDMVGEHLLSDGTNLVIRPIRPEDAVLEREFVDKLSERSRYLRFMHPLKALSADMLSRFTQLDYEREMALIALLPVGDGHTQLGVTRYATYPDGRTCEFAVVVADEWQRRGIATELMARLIEVAKARGLERMEGIMLRENVDMIALSERLGFEEHTMPDDRDLVKMTLRL